MKQRFILIFFLVEIFIVGNVLGETVGVTGACPNMVAQTGPTIVAIPDIRSEPAALMFSKRAGATGASIVAPLPMVDFSSSAEYVANEVIVKFRPGTLVGNPKCSVRCVTTQSSTINQLLNTLGVRGMNRVFTSTIGPLADIYRLSLAGNTPVGAALNQLSSHPDVEWAEANYIGRGAAIPNDTDFPRQWGLKKIEADLAWDIEIGDSNIVVAVIDTGIDYHHVDLVANIWRNSGEIPENGLDDDANGYIDDDIGWDFVSATYGGAPGEDMEPRDRQPMDFHGHGTHLSGIIAAATNNNIGIAAVARNCQIMAVRAGFKKTDGTSWFHYSDAAAAITYAADNGANVINMSWGGQNPSNMLQSAIDYAARRGVVLIAAAKNNSASTPRYPAAYPNVIAVAASDQNDNRASFSNYGSWVDVAAPGVSIYTTTPGNSYEWQHGTSMAAPFVAGLAGLILSQNPLLTPDLVKTRILETADDVGWAKRINAYKALSSGENTFMVYNDGNAELHVTSITSADASTWLSVESQIPIIVAPGASKPVVVSVNPRGLGSGIYTDRLRVVSNDPDESPSGIAVTLEVYNASPQLTSIMTTLNPIRSDQTSIVTAIAFDPDKHALSFNWKATLGTITGHRNVANYQPPVVSEQTVDIVTVTVTDNFGGIDSAEVAIIVEPEIIRYGDIDGDEAVTEYDALQLLRHVVGAITLGHRQKAVGDVNGDRALNVLDAVLILQYTAEQMTTFPVEGNKADALAVTHTQQTYHLTFPNGGVMRGEIVMLPVIADGDGEVFAGQLTLTYDPQLVVPVDVSKTAATRHCQMAYRTDGNQLHVAFASPVKRGTDNRERHIQAMKIPILTVEWKATSQIQGESISPIILSDIGQISKPPQLNDGARVTAENGSISLYPAQTRVFPNYPNPFNPDTWIPYQLSVDTEVILKIFDINGQVVHTLELGFKPAGFYLTGGRAAYWDGRNQFGERVSSGVYFYRIETANVATTGKMVVLK